MQEFGLLANLNGQETLPYWNEPPCNSLRASEGSFFPPRYYTNEDIVYLYDKDICRIFPLQYRESSEKHGELLLLQYSIHTINMQLSYHLIFRESKSTY